MPTIQWFPGHMAKTRRLLTENLKLVDVVVELLDARIPRSSQNPEINSLVTNKPRIVLLNKSDLADENISKAWRKHFLEMGIKTLFIDSTKGKGFQDVKSAIKEAVKEKIARELAKGRRMRSVRTMVVGIPNVGKSSFINQIAGKACTATGDKPGVTRGKQWIRLNEEIELLDTPGILWPKFEDPIVGLNLAYTGAVKDDVFDTVEVTAKLIEHLKENYPTQLLARYKITSLDGTGLELLETIGRKRGCIVSGGVVDLIRISAIILDELRGGKIGKITLEKPQGAKKNEQTKNIDKTVRITDSTSES